MPAATDFSRVPFHGVVIWDCAGEHSMRTARYLYDDLAHVCGSTIATCESKRELFKLLRSLIRRCKDEGFRPILHIDAHGSQTGGLQVGRDMVSWAELGERLRLVNAACAGGLGVVLAACHGIYGFDAVDMDWPSPFAFLVGPPDVITQDDLRRAMSRFYRELVTTGSLQHASRKLANNFIVLSAEAFFYVAFARVIKMHLMGKAGRQRVEDLVSRGVNEGMLRDPAALAWMRKVIRANNRNPESSYNSIGRKFLHGRPLTPFSAFCATVRGGAN